MHATAAAETVVGAAQTLDAISDLITDGRAGFFIRFLPCDVALALGGDGDGGGAEGGAGGWAARQMRAALALTSEHVGGEGVVLKALPGFDGGWNCSCGDTRSGGGPRRCVYLSIYI